MNAIVHELATGLRFPEGPIAMPDGSIVLVEIERQCVSRVTANGTVTVIAFTGGGPNGAAIGPDGKCYVCNNGGLTWHESAQHGLRPSWHASDHSGGSIQRVDLATGAVECLYEASDRARLSSPNDLVFDRTGGFWFTDMGSQRSRELARGSVCYAKADGSSIREVIFPMLTPNGIGLSPNEDRLYVTEMMAGRVWVFDILAPGEIVRHPWPRSGNGGLLLASMEGFRNLDSMAVDSAGNVCVATLMAGGITVISADGRSRDHVVMPDPMTTNICFGGPGLETAYITLGTSGKLVSMQWRCAGLGLNFVNASPPHNRRFLTSLSSPCQFRVCYCDLDCPWAHRKRATSAQMHHMKILIIEDELKTAAYLQRGLTEQGHAVDITHDGIDGRHAALENSYDVIVLDVMLPGIDGFQVLRDVRRQRQTPILMLTARDQVEDRVRGLSEGADDYLIKPFSFLELSARLHALSRRNREQEPTRLQVGDMTLDQLGRKVWRKSERIDLTAKEFALLAALARRHGQVLSRTELAELVWDMNFDSNTNTVEVAVKRLRAKLDGPYDHKLLHTVRGMGYVLEARRHE